MGLADGEVASLDNFIDFTFSNADVSSDLFERSPIWHSHDCGLCAPADTLAPETFSSMAVAGPSTPLNAHKDWSPPEPAITSPFDNDPTPRVEIQFTLYDAPDATRQQGSPPMQQTLVTDQHWDIDTDASWDQVDEEQIWSTRLRDQLANFRSSLAADATMVTEPLSSDKRRKVHSMCHLMGLSHMSFADSGEKRVLIAKCFIKPSKQCSSKVWNSPKGFDSRGYVDPFSVALGGRWISPEDDQFDERGGVVVARLECAGLPIPAQVILPYHDSTANTVAILRYDNAQSAYAVYDSSLAMRYSVPDHNDGKLRSVQIEQIGYHHTYFDGYCAFSGDTVFPAASIIDVKALKVPATHSQPNGTAQERTERSGSTTSYLSESSSNDTSASSSYSLVPDYEVTSTSRRKRKHVGGYVCHADNCVKVVNRECDRRKHEKVHSRERAHVCSACSKGFHWPKDLRRHEKRHHAKCGGE